MASIVKPQVLVAQEFKRTPAQLVQQLRACVVGPLARLHRFSVAAEQALIGVGAYDRLVDQTYAWPDRAAGSLVDVPSIRLFVKDALLLYFEDLIGDATSGRGTVAPVSGKKNRVRSSAVNFTTNGDYARSELLGDRDVAVGDRVYVRGVTDSEGDCDEAELWSYVSGFAADAVDATIADATEDTDNQASTTAATSYSKTAGAVNCVDITTADGSAYTGLASGYVTETYTVEVIRSSVAGCNAARLRVTSASGEDNVDEVTPADFGQPTDIGTRGLTATWDVDSGTCSLSATSNEVETGEFVVGQKWEIVVTQAFERVCGYSGGTYTGADDDTYIVEVTRGGLWASLPQISVTTQKGLDYSGPTSVTADDTDVPIGSHGVTIQFGDCFGANLSQASFESEPAGGDSAIAGLRTGDKFYIAVATGANGPVRTLVLRHDLPAALSTATDLDLRLFLVRDVEATETRLSSPPDTNYDVETTQLVVKAGMTAYDDTWTVDAVEQPLTVFAGDLYIEYREWLSPTNQSLQFIADVADLSLIPGQQDVGNPLKNGLLFALQNANGTPVGLIPVADPSSLDSWAAALGKADGRPEIYNFSPQSDDREVLSLFQAQVAAESGQEAANWKAMFAPLTITATKMLVGKSTAAVQLLTPTSTDGGLVLATLDDNPAATNTQYTRLSVPAGNSGFITYGVRAGDVVRFLFTIDAFGASTYREFVVDSILSENTLLLLAGHTSAINLAQKIEIWRPLTKDEVVTDLIDQAASYADRRVCAVLPDVAGVGGTVQPGYAVCAALAGLVSGVMPHQPLTNVELHGFDDLASRTRNFFTESQLLRLEQAGIWIATEDRDGVPHTRHALTTDISALTTREESMRRNLDAISYLFLGALRPYIGRTNVTPVLIQRLNYVVDQIIKALKTNIVNPDVGPQLIAGAVALDDNGIPQLAIHPIMADRVVIVLNLTLPAPLNNVQLSLVV